MLSISRRFLLREIYRLLHVCVFVSFGYITVSHVCVPPLVYIFAANEGSRKAMLSQSLYVFETVEGNRSRLGAVGEQARSEEARLGSESVSGFSRSIEAIEAVRMVVSARQTG